MLHAQETQTSNTTTNKPSTNPAARARPFHGKVKAIDRMAMTITSGSTTFQVTSQTKITKDGKPATLEDGAVGDNVSAYLKKDDNGKWNASSINFGQKPKPAVKPSNTTTNTP